MGLRVLSTTAVGVLVGNIYVGDLLGACANTLGCAVGFLVGCIVGGMLGLNDGSMVGSPDGSAVGEIEGSNVGALDGNFDGRSVGKRDTVGALGLAVGRIVLGLAVGMMLGSCEG